MKKAFCKQFDLSHESRRESMQIRDRIGVPSPMQVIRENCLDCTGGSPAAVKSCGIVNCRMWPYRFGRNPKDVDLKAPIYDGEGKLIDHTDYPGYPQNKKKTGEQENESDR